MHYREHAGKPFGDAWILLAAAGMVTTRLRIGPLITPVARRRPAKLAREITTLDTLTNGRTVFGAGLGAPVDDEYGSSHGWQAMSHCFPTMASNVTLLSYRAEDAHTCCD